MAGTVIAGLTYLILQWIALGQFTDPFFIGLLFAGTSVLLLGLGRVHRHLEEQGRAFFAFVELGTELSPGEKSSELIARIFHPHRTLALAIAYGGLLASAPWIVGVWEDHFGVRVLLSCVLFAVNFVAGVGFYALIMVTRFSWEVAPEVSIDLWNRDNISTDFLRTLTHGSAKIAAGYIGLCIASILFSPFPLQGLVVGYSLFAASVILLAFVVPELPLRDRILAEKRRVLRKVNAALHDEFQITGSDEDNAEQLPDLTRIREIIQLRAQIANISTWPFGVSSANTAITVFGMAMLPKILEVLLSIVL